MSKILTYSSDRINLYQRFLDDEKKICNYYPIKFIVSSELTIDQRKCYEYIEQELENPCSVTRSLILGAAGSGKSYLLNCIRALLESRMDQTSIIVISMTGMAASLIGGQTVHSAFKFNMRHESSDWIKNEMKICKHMQIGGERRMNELKTIKRNCIEFGSVASRWRFIILDEVSFLSLSDLGQMEEIIRKELGKPDLSGISFLCFGDFRQLPSFTGKPLFTEPSSCQLEQAGKRVYDSMNAIFFLDIPVRQGEPAQKRFREILLRLADGNLEQPDVDFLNTRAMKNLSEQELLRFKGVTHLYPRNSQVDEYNELQFNQMENEKVKIQYDLQAKKTFKVGIGSPVYLTQNVWIGSGLANGSIGTVESIVYAEGDDEPTPPAFINVNFPGYRAGKPLEGSGIPIFPTNPIFGRNSMIKTFPLNLAHSFSFHKAQSQNLDRVVANLSSLWSPKYAFAFVALSRAKRLEDIALVHEIELEDVAPYPGDPFLEQRLAEEKRLRDIAM